MEENANQSNPREILERICTLAKLLMLEAARERERERESEEEK